MLELAEARDMAKHIQNMRSQPGAQPFNALPSLRRLSEQWTQTEGRRVTVKLPGRERSILLLGSWEHIHLLMGICSRTP